MSLATTKIYRACPTHTVSANAIFHSDYHAIHSLALFLLATTLNLTITITITIIITFPSLLSTELFIPGLYLGSLDVNRSSILPKTIMEKVRFVSALFFCSPVLSCPIY